MSLKRGGKQTQANPLKPMLMSQTCNPWNSRSRLNKKSQSLTNLIVKDGIEQKILISKINWRKINKK
jgi:hypothetical protein